MLRDSNRAPPTHSVGCFSFVAEADNRFDVHAEFCCDRIATALAQAGAMADAGLADAIARLANGQSHKPSTKYYRSVPALSRGSIALQSHHLRLTVPLESHLQVLTTLAKHWRNKPKCWMESNAQWTQTKSLNLTTKMKRSSRYLQLPSRTVVRVDFAARCHRSRASPA